MRISANQPLGVVPVIVATTFFVCSGLSVFCPMLHATSAAMAIPASHTDHTMGAGGGCPDSLAPSAEQFDHRAPHALQITEVTSPLPDPSAPALAISAPPTPDFWGLPRYKLTSVFRI